MYGQTGAWSAPGYTEIRELGTGGGGRVVLARHDADGIQVAIKYLSDELRSDLNFVGRFRQEAHLLALMEPSPHAARFYEYIEAPLGAAIVMELVDGVSLRTMLRSEGPTGPEAALTVLKGSLLGLAAAHAVGVVHRDYKPENVLVEADGMSKLVDFGIAARAGEGVGASGTPPYMAPEQWSGSQASRATDVYAATVVFFECLTGTRPFRAQSLPALARQHQSTPPPVDEVPHALQGLIERGMAKNPADRHPSAEAFLRELESVAGEAYGPAWEDRGRRRLAALAGLLLPFFPLAEEPPEATTTLAETHVGGSPLTKISVRIGLVAIAVAVVGGGAATLVGSFGDAELRAGTTIETPSTTPTDLGIEDEDDSVPEMADVAPTPSAKPSRTASPSPSPSPSPTPAVRTTPPPAPSAKPSPTRRPTPSRTPTRPRPRPSQTTPEPDDTVNIPELPGVTSTPTQPRNTPTTAPSTNTPTNTVRPTDPPTTPQEPPPQLTSAPVPSASMGAFALGLVTTGLVPATLAVKRMTGRHRRRR
ncbi:serine/threonine-protein kinase [Microtetraspora niveoalba]|uniref:serine/threonine-protein kinase n=1 Tax=Microtetraspora niveoalba TaxID=46175 RepID=UPI000836EAB8|nr:serine/threonine-protein kinase [Microtetraspora niveoalba]